VAEERGDFQPRDEMARLLAQLNETVPAAAKPTAAGTGGGFHCQRPGCPAGLDARQLSAPPFGVDRPLAERIVATVCADCWNDWFRLMSIKVINELRLDLSTDHGAEEYDRYMREYLGLD
jgi:Fe-S cluster biosynthesis and repair protein YggX